MYIYIYIHTYIHTYIYIYIYIYSFQLGRHVAHACACVSAPRSTCTYRRSIKYHLVHIVDLSNINLYISVPRPTCTYRRFSRSRRGTGSL